jgi:deazaflavin-dependent oxidoreductase (nitroreductase family)
MIDFEQRRSGLLRRMVRRAAEIVPMSWIRPRLVVPVDREVFRLSGGRTTLSALVSGLPIIMLTTTGARTGQARAVPVLGLPADDRLVLIASNFGKPSNPGWYYNLRAHPHAVVTWNGPPARCKPASCRATNGSGTSTSASRPIRGGSRTTTAPRRAKSP